ncbi:transketolase [Sulfobacillus harzensis]|uniref:Transketolase n=1 Tax=Sulfobacillus harzensis TaxID=2729629 RepID=A0A7Y0Q2Y0_9FIRM|nr:transketolase [Sulfobacillus harzensis]NMP22835.1 transketolase [Sulfobacillus harzensis]
MVQQDLQQEAINSIRGLAIDGVEAAKQGHPGLPLGAAAMGYTLWTKFLHHNPHNPHWLNRDRFILSAGHGSMLLYALLYLTGYDLPLDELKRFRQWQSKTPGHPEYGLTPGVETTTGPLGQGFATGVGMAIAEAYLSARYNKPGFDLIDHYTYAIVSDGDLMEGISSEAASLAGTLSLGKLIYLYDDNHISIEGRTDIAFREDVLKRFQAYGWHTERVTDGNDVDAIEEAIKKAQADPRPSLIAVRTIIGYGSPNRQDTPKVHGEALGPEEAKLTKEFLGLPTDKTFYVPDDVLAHFRQAVANGSEWEAEWNRLFDKYRAQYPDLAQELEQAISGQVPNEALADLPVWDEGTALATRAASGQVLNRIAPRWPALIGGSADLAPSNNTNIKDGGNFSAEQYDGRNLHFGVREHAMGAALNGMLLHGGLRVYGGTFLIFSDYMRPAIRLAALMHQPAIYIFTHDSIGLGTDGPTHQPIEQLAALRAIPGVYVVRPADPNETREAWKLALNTTDHPIAMALTRQSVDALPSEKTTGLSRGAYVLWESGSHPELVIMASGSEVGVALAAGRQLADKGTAVRVVSFPCWEKFEEQDEEYRRTVLPPNTRRIAIEAGSPMGWDKYVGENGAIIGLNHFGASAPGEVLFREFGLTPEHVVDVAGDLLNR